jgi:ABC-type amino acid transport substrate-binding protein
MAFSPLNPQAQKLAVMYDNGIEELRSSGKLAKLYAKYHLAMPSDHENKSRP